MQQASPFAASPVFNSALVPSLFAGTGLSGQSQDPGPVVQLMQQATMPGIPERLKQTLFRYALQLAEERFRQ